MPPDREIIIKITETPEVNAHARLDNAASTYHIEFTLGLIVWLDSIAASMAAHVARDFNVSPSPPLTLDLTRGNWRDALQQRLDVNSELLPDYYYGAWESFFQKALLAIFAHEYAHIARGHLDWSKSQSGSGQMNERSLRKSKPVISATQTRALEFDADMFAARLLAHLATEPPDYFPRLKVGTSTENLIEALLGLILFLVAIEIEETAQEERAPDYPQPLLRMIVMLTYMQPLWTLHNPDGDFWEIVFTGALSVLKLFETIYAEIDVLRTLLDIDVNSAVVRELDDLSDDLQDLQHDVLKFAFERETYWNFGFD
ncbi:hypothetical protein [uncultured Roseobacter sp.]|uniref:hypothetical protein n=1 Tax=uncultured Roseobacter sp. TaxID=114847 RepID=UPI0026348749|nr:hypothetical protein [uncultured Roseobacter sp.]